MLKTPKRYGSFRGAVVAGIALMPFFALAPVYTFIFVGLIVGIISRGVYRAVIASVLAGLIVTSLVIIYAVIDGNAVVITIVNHAVTFYFLFEIYIVLSHVATFSTIYLLETLLLYSVAIPALGALIGGLARPGF